MRESPWFDVRKLQATTQASVFDRTTGKLRFGIVVVVVVVAFNNYILRSEPGTLKVSLNYYGVRHRALFNFLEIRRKRRGWMNGERKL